MKPARPVQAVQPGQALARATGCGAQAGSGALATFRPDQTFARRKALEAAAKYAARLGDFALLERAITEKLEEEAAFARHVQELFQKGGQPGNKNAAKNKVATEGRIVSAADYCEHFGFKSRTVQKWYPLLDDDVRKAETAKRIARARCIVLGETAVHVGQNAGETVLHLGPETAAFVAAFRPFGRVLGPLDVPKAGVAA